RCGTANVFCGIEPNAGVYFTNVTPSRSSPESAGFLSGIAEHYPTADTIHLVMDNLSTHSCIALVDQFGEQAGAWLWEQFTVHYTPKLGSWLHQAAIEIRLFSRLCQGKRRIGNIVTRRRQTKAWNRGVNRDHITIRCQFTSLPGHGTRCNPEHCRTKVPLGAVEAVNGNIKALQREDPATAT
ncbi:MAG: transposase, partial [Terracidiphilus sp.]